MPQSAIHPAIVFEPDGYRTDGQRLMGRQAAGNGFLRAAVAASGSQPVIGYTPSKASAQVFARTVAQMDPAARTQWLPPGRPDLLAKAGHLYMPGPIPGDLARQRLRAGPAAWSITGVTHTTASHGAMDAIAELLTAPVMPWDALICTSQAVLSTVRIVLDAQADYLRWRFGPEVALTLPQLPVIPLGVHCGDFAIEPARRKTARDKLGIADDEVVALFVGRLSFHAKAHPHAMYMGLQAAARSSGRKLVLVQCGWFANDAIETAFREGAASACPDVRCLFTDGRRDEPRMDSWAAADLFVSLSDNIQETFGLSPIEAMAAGLPVVVTDWDGYKDTVRDGVDGFRIPTWMPPAGAGEPLARAHESGEVNYDMYCGLACMHVAVDPRSLADRLTRLVSDSALRRRMGDAGQQRARQHFDWALIYRRYQDLWRELDRLRANAPAAVQPAAPRAAPARLDPFVAFAHYPARPVELDTRIFLRERDPSSAYRSLAAQSLFSYASTLLPPAPVLDTVWPALASTPMDVRAFARTANLADTAALRAVAVLAKMGLVDLEGPGPQT